MSKLKEKVAVITGASKGIGAAIAKRFAAEGASVVVNYVSSKEDADKVVSEITKSGGKAVAIKANVSKKAEIENLFAEAKKAFGKVDILVNNAGVYEFSPIKDFTEEQFEKMFGINVRGSMLAARELVRHIGKEGGSIINISSVASTAAPPSASVYSATKGAVDTLTKSLAKELGPLKIKVNAINPGMIETEGVHSAGFMESEFQKQVEAQTPLGRVGQPEDVAPVAVFFASSDSDWVTGETLNVAGGYR